MPIYKVEGEKKDGKQKYRVRVNCHNALGEPYQLTRIVYGSQEAKELERQLTQEYKHAKPGANITVAQLFEEFKASRLKSVRETTFIKSARIINNHVIPTFGNTKLSKLNVRTLQSWKNTIDATDLSLRTKKNIYGEFRSLLNFANNMEYMPDNPLLRIGNFTDAMYTGSAFDYYTPEEFKKFIAAARAEAEKAEAAGDMREWGYYVFFCIAFFCGMRKGEINGLQWDDIDGEYITVRRSIAQKLKGGDRVTPPKTKASIRTLQLPLPLQRVLRDHRSRCELIQGFDDKKYICGFSRALRDTTLDQRNRKYAKLASIKAISIHSFRHSHASCLANEGIIIQEIARRLGHSDVNVTLKTYTHLYPREEERAIRVLNAIDV